MLEGVELVCPWTARRITAGVPYDLDHLLPVSIYPINELWNLLPSDPDYNRFTKRDRIPSTERLQQALPHLERDYTGYGRSETLAKALSEDVALRFSTLAGNRQESPRAIAGVVVDLIEQVAQTRNLARF